ncbi:TPA: DUF2829 domain-containing protein [Citrobacter freundii]|nr:DUF2829 domain-containing protein [Citrobacter freundii]HCD1268055.1 DUF2829 domain-containing protein [Citrobacter freundii]
MKTYVLPVPVKTFQIDRIEGFPRFPLRASSIPAPTPGGMRMVYSTDDEDKPVCVDSVFINQINPGEDGYYVEYPNGNAVFWEAKNFNEVFKESAPGTMDFPTAASLLLRGLKVYRQSWMMDGVYIQCEGGNDSPSLYLVDSVGTGFNKRVWVPGQADMFGNDWAVYEDKL